MRLRAPPRRAGAPGRHRARRVARDRDPVGAGAGGLSRPWTRVDVPHPRTARDEVPLRAPRGAAPAPRVHQHAARRGMGGPARATRPGGAHEPGRRLLGVEVTRMAYGPAHDQATPGLGVLPAPIVLVTAAADVQTDYVVCLTVGWGLDGQAWVLDWDELTGNPRDPATLDALLQGLAAARYAHPAHGAMPVHLVAIDTGFCTDDVWRAIRGAPRPRWVHGTKGEIGRLGEPMILPRLDVRDHHGHRRGYRPLRINTDAAKQELMAVLQLAPGARGSWHFSKRLDAEFYAQLASEELRPRFNEHGVQTGHAWVKTRERNEALDCAVGNLALWHWVPDRELFAHLAQLVGHAEASSRWHTCYPSGRRFL